MSGAALGLERLDARRGLAIVRAREKEEADAARAQARKDLDEENAALPGKIRELRRQQGSR